MLLRSVNGPGRAERYTRELACDRQALDLAMGSFWNATLGLGDRVGIGAFAPGMLMGMRV